MRGEFRFDNGLVLPNNISIAGAKAILDSAFRLQSQTWFAALVSGAPTVDMNQSDMLEPSIGVNGYARVSLAHNSTGWPVLSDVNGHAFIESAPVLFTPTGGNFSRAIQRAALMLTETFSAESPIVSLSAPLPVEVVLTPTTPEADRRFTYRIYL